eukprot:evm.model.scf_1849.1 EVM.evm.TU.scf_1849.1   scf_1849:25081-30921(-)
MGALKAAFGILLVSAILCGALASAASSTRRRPLSDGRIKFNYAKSGDDWPAVNCKYGKEQSPINVEPESTPAFENTSLHMRLETFGKGNNVRTFSNGQALQVMWDWVEQPNLEVPVVDGSYFGALDEFNPKAEIKYMKVEPIQFHFHTPSENTINGRFYPMEAHIVSRIAPHQLPDCGDGTDDAPAGNCLVVFAVHFEFSVERNMFFNMIFNAAPRQVGEEFAAPIDEEYILNMDLLVPVKKSYFMWKGSLTTPPCTENVLWVLFKENELISVEELTSLQNHMRDVKTACMEVALEDEDASGMAERVLNCNNVGDRTNNRPIQSKNHRIVKKLDLDES